MTIFIYGLLCPIENTIRYVGKSNNPQDRFRSHLSSARRNAYDHHTSRWIRKLLADGLRPRLIILEQVADAERWQHVERAYIASAEYRGWQLTNSTAGGEGLDYLCLLAQAAYRAKLSVAHKIIWNTPERKEEARKRSLDAWADPEITVRRKASQEIARAKPETKARFVAAGLDINSRPEVKEKRKKSLQNHWAVPENKARRLAATGTQEVKKKQSDSKKDSWKDPEFQKKQADSWTPERRAQQAEKLEARREKIRAACSTPEYKAKRAATIRAKTLEKKRRLAKAAASV